jgi:hypothetical protein
MSQAWVASARVNDAPIVHGAPIVHTPGGCPPKGYPARSHRSLPAREVNRVVLQDVFLQRSSSRHTLRPATLRVVVFPSMDKRFQVFPPSCVANSTVPYAQPSREDAKRMWEMSVRGNTAWQAAL